MRRTFWIAALAIASVCGSLQGASPDADQIHHWLKQLDDEDFARREEATAKLQAAGEASIDALAQGAVSSSPEAAWRAGEALKQIAIDGNDKTLDRVASALERVGMSSRNGMNQVVAEIRGRQRQIRHDRAATKIRQLGGGLSGGGIYGEETVWLGGGLMMPVAMPIVEVEERLIEVVVEEPAEAPAEVADEVARAVEVIDKAKDALPKPLTEDLDDVVKDLFPAKPEPLLKELARVIDARFFDPPAAAEAKPVVEAKPALEAKPAIVVKAGVRPAIEVAPEEAKPADDEPIADLEFAPAMGAAIAVDFIGGDVIEVGSGGHSESLSLDGNWRGGDKGLEVLRDLPEISSLAIRGAKLTDAGLVHIAALPKLRSIQIQGTKFSVAALRKLHRARPEAYMFCQGEAMVGIHADTTGSCTLTSVYPGSGAADAGLQSGDKIVAIDDVDVKDFSELTISVYARGVGDKLKIEFERDGKRQTTEVELRARKVLEP